MNIIFSSKTEEYTAKLKSFIQQKLKRLQKFPALGLYHLEVIVDRVKRHGKTTSDTQIEIIADVKGKRLAFREIGSNIYQTFFRLYERVEKTLRRKNGEFKEK